MAPIKIYKPMDYISYLLKREGTDVGFENYCKYLKDFLFFKAFSYFEKERATLAVLNFGENFNGIFSEFCFSFYL